MIPFPVFVMGCAFGSWPSWPLGQKLVSAGMYSKDCISIEDERFPMDNYFEQEIQNITDQIIKKYNPEKIILFGSAARGEFDINSDADFLIIKNDTPESGVDRIRELSRIIERNIPIDLIVYRPSEFQNRLDMGDPFIKSILHEGKTLYG